MPETAGRLTEEDRGVLADAAAFINAADGQPYASKVQVAVVAALLQLAVHLEELTEAVDSMRKDICELPDWKF